MRNSLNFVSLILSLFVWLAVVGSASGQGFMVEPMIMHVSASPTKTAQLTLRVFNTAIDQKRTIRLRLVDLSQTAQGSWTLARPSPSQSPKTQASALKWTELSAGNVDVEPQKYAAITVSITPPARARGAYLAAIIAEAPQPDTRKGIVLRTRFLIPIIINIRGRTVRERIALDDVDMHLKSEDGGNSTTTADMVVSNSGRTYSRVSGSIVVESKAGTSWRVVTRVPIAEHGIIPGASLDLGGDLNRSLPSGKYRLRAELQVDGRRFKPLQKVIEFAGDPTATVAYDATLHLRPSSVDMKVVPGATRTGILQIQNTSEHPVKIELEAMTPRTLRGMRMGDVLGNDLSAEPWTKIEPSAFTLRSKGSQNVRVVASVPKDGVDYPDYYANLTLHGTYVNGQSAGTTFSTIRLQNISKKSKVDVSIQDISVAEGEDSKFIFSLNILNSGNVDFQPTAELSLYSAKGKVVTSEKLSGDTGMLLPLGLRVFSGELDFSHVRPGTYGLIAQVTTGEGKKMQRRYAVKVKEKQSVEAAGTKPTSPSVTLSDGAPEVGNAGKVSQGDPLPMN